MGRLHPRMDSSRWKEGVLCLKDLKKKFRVGRAAKTSILKWRMTSKDEESVPITLQIWPEEEGDGAVQMNATFAVKEGMTLKNVMITFPTPTKREPEVANCEVGDTSFYRSDEEFQWVLGELEGGSEGALEYMVEEVDIEDLWPISVHFCASVTAHEYPPSCDNF